MSPRPHGFASRYWPSLTAARSGIGRWVRPDGGYILELKDPRPGHELTAVYFNPQPVNVGRAEWKQQDGQLGVFVELRAPNYPGSTYTLAYDPTNDRLAGIYYQAALQQQFDVAFERVPLKRTSTRTWFWLVIPLGVPLRCFTH